MESFIGDYQCKIDAKGRFLFPSTLKKQMQKASTQDRFVIKKDIYEQCLILYTAEEWERQNKIIRKKLNPYNKDHSRFLRAFYQGTAEITLDSNNRILIPKRLLEQINANKEIYLSGQDQKIEIWATELFQSNVPDQEEFAQMAGDFLGSLNLDETE